jgi:hypothetical protein
MSQKFLGYMGIVAHLSSLIYYIERIDEMSGSYIL